MTDKSPKWKVTSDKKNSNKCLLLSSPDSMLTLKKTCFYLNEIGVSIKPRNNF